MIISDLKWHCRWISKSAEYATWSKDPSTKVGSVVVKDRRQLTAGFNGFPEGVNDNDMKKWERPDKYCFVEHAERNAINQGALHGISLAGATLYINYSPPPCDSCTRSIIQTHIKSVIGSTTEFPGKGEQWQHSAELACIMLLEAGIEVYRIPGTWANLDDKGNPVFTSEKQPNHYSFNFEEKEEEQSIQNKYEVIERLIMSNKKFEWEKIQLFEKEIEMLIGCPNSMLY